MRLVCPNCDAEYEVDDAAIPRAGRDVQCSNCGHAWFQAHPDVTAEAEDEEALFGTKPEAEPEAGHEVSGLPAGDILAHGLPEPEPEPEPEPAPPPSAPPPPVAEPPRRSIDESVLAVLREEAEREAAARRGERPAIETQTELPLPEAARPAPKAPERRVEAPPPMPAIAPAAPEPVASRKRALLPAIEEIKSSLHPASEREDLEGGRKKDGGTGGFRSGFVFVLLIAVIFLAVYVLAPEIGERVPALKPWLARYVETVNELRVALNDHLRALTARLRALASG